MAAGDVDVREREAGRPSGAEAPGLLSSARVFSQPVGAHIRPGELHGYYVDLSPKAQSPSWPPPWLPAPEDEYYVHTAQWGLGAYERWLTGDGEAWLSAATDCAAHLVSRQESAGRLAGGWIHRKRAPHTYDIRPPWLSAMVQGESASLLVRAHAQTGEDRFAEAALAALKPLSTPLDQGGVRASLGAGFLLQEYPTDPPSHVLNGSIFALWGLYDVAIALEDATVRAEFERGLAALAENIERWDTGWWSRYDLFPFRVGNVASSFYHQLHIDQLAAMQLIAPRQELEAARSRFVRYAEARSRRLRAFAHKVLFRVLIPRNRLLARRTPFARPRPDR